MKARFLGVVFILVVSVLLNVPSAHAGVEPVSILHKLFAGLNTGELDVALVKFAEDAVIEDRVRHETYRGLEEIEVMLRAMQREGRQYDIVRLEMIGSRVALDIDISDHGYVWAHESIIVEVQGDKVQTFTVTEFQFKFR